MNRRELLRVLGGAVAFPALSGLSEEQLFALGRSARGRALQVLDPHQNATVTTIAELIIPATDTPGARAARVNEFIDLVLAEWVDDDDRTRFLAGLADVDARARSLFSKDFVDCAANQQSQILTALDQELAEQREADKLGGRRRAQAAAPRNNFFSTMKRLTLVGYYTSEIGANQELHYQIIPGRYDGCVPLGSQ